MKELLVGFLLMLGTQMVSSATETRFESGPAQTSLVELYTSEGCSSCPPAEAWMSHLKSDAGLWKNFVPLAFHVDYWDRLGWRDRLSSPQWTERQRNYAALWRSESVYTPAVVLNGREERDWSSANPSQPNEKLVGVLRVTSADGKSFTFDFKPATGGTADYEAHLALLASGISTNVRAGENSGRNLEHDFVVLNLQSVALKSEAGEAKARLTISANVESGARRAVAAWVSRRGQLAAVQATGGWLP